MARRLLFGFVVVALVFAVGCPSRQSVVRPDDVRSTVGQFLDLMPAARPAPLVEMVSAAWLKANGLDTVVCSVRLYLLKSYEIEGVSADTATVLIRFASGPARRMTFRVSRERGRNYIVPSTFGGRSIVPWITNEEVK
jgi:hypothetical protein